MWSKVSAFAVDVNMLAAIASAAERVVFVIVIFLSPGFRFVVSALND